MIGFDESRPFKHTVEEDSECDRNKSEQDDDEQDVEESESTRHEVKGVHRTDET